MPGMTSCGQPAETKKDKRQNSETILIRLTRYCEKETCVKIENMFSITLFENLLKAR